MGTYMNDLQRDCLFFFFLLSCHSIHTMEHEFYECPEYLSNTPAEVERTEEYEYEVQLCIFLLFEWTHAVQYMFLPLPSASQSRAHICGDSRNSALTVISVKRFGRWPWATALLAYVLCCILFPSLSPLFLSSLNRWMGTEKDGVNRLITWFRAFSFPKKNQMVIMLYQIHEAPGCAQHNTCMKMIISEAICGFRFPSYCN